jgi:hypothetical protein
MQAPFAEISFTKQLQMKWPVKEETSPGRFRSLRGCLRGSWAI